MKEEMKNNGKIFQALDHNGIVTTTDLQTKKVATEEYFWTASRNNYWEEREEPGLNYFNTIATLPLFRIYL